MREKKPGEWWIFINHHKKRISKKVGNDRRQALEVAKKIEAKLILEDFNLGKKDGIPTYREYAEKWLETYVKNVRRASTYRRYREIFTKYAFPEIGHLPLNKITRGHIKDILLKLNEKGLSRGSLAIVKNAISGPFTYAIDEELISVNPSSGVLKSLNIQTDKREFLDPFTHEEVKLFLETCLTHFPEYYAFFLSAFRTGMRLGELLALQWGDIDFHGKFIQVSKSYKLGKISATKTGRVRRVEMSNQLLEVLKAHHRLCKEQGFKIGLGDAPEWVFHRDGMPLEQNFIRRIFERILAKAGLRKIRFHDIRHTYASLLLSEGISPVYVKEQLGHSSIQMTVDIYGHWIPSANKRAVNLLDTSFSANKPSDISLSQTHPNAPQTHPAEIKRPQLIEIAALS